MLALLVGRFHGVTRGQADRIAGLGSNPSIERIVCVITSSNHQGTRRNPLPVGLREELVRPVLAASGKPFDLVRMADVGEDFLWAAALTAAASRLLHRAITPATASVFTANRDVGALFGAAGFPVVTETVAGITPHELLQRAADGREWQDQAAPSTAEVWNREGIPAQLRRLFGQRLLNDDGELGHARDFDSYGSAMDAALGAKLADLVPWILPGKVVDKGCGTGSLLVALAAKWPASSFVGVDLSREFLRRCNESTYASQDVMFLFGDVRDALVDPGTASSVIFSSVMHEVYSYTGYDRSQIDRALANATRELGPRGRLLMRDGVSPGAGFWRLRMLERETRERFALFAQQFKHGQGAPHERLSEDCVRISAHLANEFLCKKDYAKNWHIEVHEEFGALTVEGWRDALARAGLRTLEARAYVNPWIAANRYEGKVALTDDAGAKLPWPATNVVVVGEKP